MLKPIETVYNGYRFRSRLEARWAVFFDTLDIKYEYEKEGYDLGDAGWYLPDFWLPKYRYWIEIKGQIPTNNELGKCKTLFDFTGSPVIIFSGLPDPGGASQAYYCGLSEKSSNGNFRVVTHIEVVNWEVCLRCNEIDLSFDLKRNGPIYNHRTGESLTPCSDPPYVRNENGLIIDANQVWEHPRLIKAYTAARQARFEHGEKG